MRGIAFTLALLFVVLPTIAFTGELSARNATTLFATGLIMVVLLLALFSLMERLVAFAFSGIGAESSYEEPEPHDRRANPALWGLYFGCVVAATITMVLIFRDDPWVSGLIAYDFSGRRPGLLLIAFPLLFLFSFAKWIESHSND